MSLNAPASQVWPDPVTALRRMQEEMNRLLGDYRLQPSVEFPPINVWRGEDGVVVTARVPGVGIDDIDIVVRQSTLTIKGRREPEAREGEAALHRQERVYGTFARTVSTPFNVDAEKVRASMRGGILRIDLPRPEAEKPKRIEIKAS